MSREHQERPPGIRPSPGARPGVHPKPWETLDEVLRRELDRLPMDWEAAACLSGLAEKWPAVAGPLMAAHAAPGELRGDALLVWVDNSAWLSELSRLHARALLERIRCVAGCGRIQRIEFRLNPDLHRKRRPATG